MQNKYHPVIAERHTMKYLTDQCILLLYCLCSLLFLPPDSSFVTAVFLAVSVSMFLYVYPNPVFRFAVTLVFAALLFILPQLTLFLPLAIYSFYLPGQKKPGASVKWLRFAVYLPGAAAAAGLLYQTLPPHNLQFLFYICVGCLLSVLLRQKTDSYETLAAVSRKTHDDDTERKLLLEEKNQSLVEKQNYEIYAATLGERNRIAREIHDNVGHMLTRSILMVGALKAMNKEDALNEPLCQLDATLNSAMNSIRESVHDLRDRSVNLEGALHTLADDFRFCPVSLHYDMSGNIPADVKYCLIAVTKEALVNISRHSSATAAKITAQEHPAFYQLSIQDNGTGNAAHAVHPPESSAARGMGLSNMQSRVASLNGTLRILDKQGFCIFITIPK